MMMIDGYAEMVEQWTRWVYVCPSLTLSLNLNLSTST